MKLLEELILPVVALLLALAYAFDISDIRDPLENLKLVGPLLVLLVLACIGTIVSILCKYKWGDLVEVWTTLRIAETLRANKAVAALPLLSLLYLFSLPYLGVVVCTTTLLLVLFELIGGRRRLAELIYSVALGAAIVFVFEYMLGRNLPGYF